MAGTYRISSKGIVIGEGRPGIIVPASGASPREIIGAVRDAAALPQISAIEVRLDALDSGRNSDEIIELTDLVSCAHDAAGAKALLITVRTSLEGGGAAYSGAEYFRLIASLIDFAPMDLVDIEASRDERLVRELAKRAKRRGVGAVMSRHDFGGTPSVDEMLAILRREKDLGGDILKIAVMPRDSEDVANLLLATSRAGKEGLGPLITMAMGALGAVTRVAGGVFGSAMTFAMNGTASAPGQLGVEDTGTAMRILGL